LAADVAANVITDAAESLSLAAGSPAGPRGLAAACSRFRRTSSRSRARYCALYRRAGALRPSAGAAASASLYIGGQRPRASVQRAARPLHVVASSLVGGDGGISQPIPYPARAGPGEPVGAISCRAAASLSDAISDGRRESEISTPAPARGGVDMRAYPRSSVRPPIPTSSHNKETAN
jgi:hypothetical protein